MNFQELHDHLKKLGYDREEDILIEYANKAAINKDFSNKTLNHTILEHCRIVNSNFNQAAVTGSMFNHCKFLDCLMEMTDFEFCDFKHCEISSGQKTSASFNNSTFYESEFRNITFDSALLTGTYFQKCVFDHVTISYTTMENSVFQECTFHDVNLQNLNLDYVELVKPSMKNVILPMAQIPYMFGCLQYLMETSDNITIIGTNSEAMTKQTYLSQVIPFLVEFFAEKMEYFPIANIYIAQKNNSLALHFLVEGIAKSIAQKDFRMIKFYCKLVSNYGIFPQKVLHDFYRKLCRLLPVDNMETIGYIKNIGEIKYLLFDKTRKTTLHFTFLTNFYSKEIDKVSCAIGRLFKVAKMSTSLCPNDVEIKLTENSPLMIEVDICGNIDNLEKLLPKIIILTGITEEQISMYPPFDSIDDSNVFVPCLQAETDFEIAEFRKECLILNLQLTIVQYYLTDYNSVSTKDKSIYYYNHYYRKEKQYLL